MPQPLHAADGRCRALVTTRFFETRPCNRGAVEMGFCHQHLPLPVKRQREKAAKEAREVAHLGWYWFGAQVAIAALCAALTKAGYRVPTDEKRGDV